MMDIRHFDVEATFDTTDNLSIEKLGKIFV